MCIQCSPYIGPVAKGQMLATIKEARRVVMAEVSYTPSHVLFFSTKGTVGNIHDRYAMTSGDLTR